MQLQLVYRSREIRSFLFSLDFYSIIIVPSMPPENVRCAPLTSQSLQISWQPPSSNHMNGLLQGYKVNFEYTSDQIGAMNDDIDSRKTTDLTIVLSGLKKFTNYSIQVLAFTRVGDGVVSKPLYCQTEEDGSFLFLSILFLLRKTNR